MRLILIRHAIAVPRGTPGVPEDDRPLTAGGEKKFRRAAAGLARLMPPPAAILTSPLRRARSTAGIAADAWGGVECRDVAALARGDDDALLAALDAWPEDATIAIVGHEPHLSALLARLLGSRQAARFAFRKGGAALVELGAAPRRGGNLLWYLPPKLLRALGSG